MAALTSPQSAVRHAFDEDALRRSCAVIAARLDSAGSEEQELVLEAVQLSVAATREEVTIEGILPLEPLNVLTVCHHCTNMGMKLRSCEKGCARLYLALSF